MVDNSTLDALRNIFTTPKSWVLFKNLSVVVIEEPDDEKSLEEQAIDIMKRDGPVIPGTPHGDFNVITAKDDQGWIVTSHNPVLYTYVKPDTIPQESANDMVVGLLGRGERHKDSESLQVVHVEHKGGQQIEQEQK